MPAPPAVARPAHALPQPAPRPRNAPAPARAAAAADSAPAADAARLVHLAILGPLRITTARKEISGGLRKARELLAFLAVHQDGVTAEAISEALWPEADPGRGDGQRNLALRKARDLLRTATGLTAPMWILHTAGRYRLDPALFSADLWQFTAALDQARHAVTDDARLAACQQAAALYHGELAEGAGYEWAEPYAETARRCALDAWTAIAAILQPRDPAQSQAALETALTHDPYNEYLYQKIMRLQAAAGHPEAVRRTLSLLEARLTELGITPGTQTRHIAASLLSTHAPPSSPAGPAPRPAPAEHLAAPVDSSPRLKSRYHHRHSRPVPAGLRVAAGHRPGPGPPLPSRPRPGRTQPRAIRPGGHSAPSASPGSVAYTCRHRNPRTGRTRRQCAEINLPADSQTDYAHSS